jgi:DNA-binding beta-propeller fold protein YncE
MIALGGDRPDRRRAFGSAVAVTVLATWVLASSALATITYQSQWGGPGPGAFEQPHGVATDAAGNVYVTDRTTDELQVFDSTGDFVTEWGGTGTANGKFNEPDSVAVDSSGTNVYVADFSNSRIQKFNPTGTFQDAFGTNGAAEGELAGPEAVAVDSTGNVYVAELFNNRIQKFDSSGNFVRMWGWGVDDGSSAFQICTSSCQTGINGAGDGQFDGPVGLAIDSSDNVYVVDEFNQRVQEFNSSGAFIRMWGWGVDDGTAALQTCTSSCETGQSGPGDGQFSNPETGIDIDSSGHVYVADQGNERVQEFDASNPTVSFVTKWGTTGDGNGQFHSPEGLAIGSGGHVYVADYSNARMQEFTGAGTFVRIFGHRAGGGAGELFNPFGVAVAPSGDVYVADSGNDRIQQFDSSGNFIRQWGTFGTGQGEFSNLQGIATDSSGHVYAADYGNSRIQEFSATGVFLREWGTPGTGDTQFGGPIDVAVGPSGNVYVADSFNNRIAEFTSTGTFIRKWGANGGDGTPGSGNGEFQYPYGVATDTTGHVFVADINNNRIQEFTASGAFIRKWGTAGTGPGQFRPGGVATDSSGNVYVTDQDADRIQKFTSTGSFISQFGTSGTGNGEFSLPQGIDTDSSTGSIYVVDLNNNRVEKLSEDMTPPAGGHILGTYPAYRLSTPFNVSWGGATDSGSGITSYKAFSRRAPFNAGFGPLTLFDGTPGPGSGTFPANPGNTYCFSVKVTDAAGNTSAASPQKCSAMPVDDASLAGRGWSRNNGQSGYYRGTYSGSTSQGAMLTRTGVQAKRLALVATRCPGCGVVDVRMGGTLLKKVSLASTTTKRRQIIPVASFAGVVSGTVTITVATSGKPVFIDGLAVSRN